MTEDRKAVPGDLLRRIAAALERLAPPTLPAPDFTIGEAFVWHPAPDRFAPVRHVSRVPLSLLKGIDGSAARLLTNTEQFARGLPANNVLLWGARGMGKSSLVKAVHAEVRARLAIDLKLIEVHREDIAFLPRCLAALAPSRARFLVFCDDLSFERGDASYKSLKAVLEGGLEGRPENVLFYATSNRRHLMPRDMADNEGASAIHPAEAVEETVSLSDRFGLWLGFHNASQDDYVEMVRTYAAHFRLAVPDGVLIKEALAWSIVRGARSGRVAWQFIQDFAGRQGLGSYRPIARGAARPWGDTDLGAARSARGKDAGNARHFV